MTSLLHALEIAGRVVAIYVALLVLLRVIGRRTMAQLRPIDLLTMLLLSETVSPALTAGDDSLGGGLVAAGTLGAAAALTSWLSFRFRWFDVLLDGATLVLVRDGKLDARVLRAQRITDEELRTALHESGVATVSEVERAFVEPDGSITIVKRKD